jgi:hypothetical protein
MLEVARWFMSTLWGSYASRCTNGLNEKKPYNPVLGEQFFCKLGDVDCICEQGTDYGIFFFNQGWQLSAYQYWGWGLRNVTEPNNQPS